MKIKTQNDLEVYQIAFKTAMKIFEITKTFPIEEKYSLIDQIRKASRSVCSNISEAFRKRRYEKAFVSKLNDSEAEAAETQCWLEFSKECQYINSSDFQELNNNYNNIIGKLVTMANHPENWIL